MRAPTSPPDNVTVSGSRPRVRPGEPTTGKDNAIVGMVLFARNTLLEQPEFQERLADATVLGRRVTTAREAGDEWGWRFWGQIYWEALAEWARDLDGLYSGAELDALISRQPEPKVIRRATVATMAGRSGRGKTLDTQVIRAAVRSLALRPEARKQLNDERSRSYRYRRGAFRPQVGHEHSPMGHDRGVTRADELVAAEISEHGRTAKWVGRCREKLREVVAAV